MGGGYQSQAPWLIARPQAPPRYFLYARAFAVANALRLTLPDAMQSSWLAPALLSWAGVALLAFNGSFLGWLLCAVGAALPILGLEDQLSQSTYLLFCACLALASFRSRDGRPASVGLAAGVRWLTIGVYAMAALHKLNRDYFNPAVSCANEGLRVTVERSPVAFADTAFTEWVLGLLDSRAWSLTHIAVELGIVVLLIWRPQRGVLLAALMHLPLTIIFAPGFAFTMMSGWLTFFSFDELRDFAAGTRKRWPWVLLLGGAPAVLSRVFLFHGRWTSDPDWCIKEMILWLVAAALVMARATGWETRPQRRFPVPRLGWIVGAFIANGLTPYFGVQFHHTAAMLSNLRIDAGCHNSLVFPEWLRGDTDPYVRVEIDFAPHRANDTLRDTVAERLWSLRALHEAREHWCHIHEEPLPARGTFRGATFDSPDICTSWPLPEPRAAGFRRYQVNLRRNCPQRCLH